MEQFVVRGVPASVLQDSWWFDSPDREQNRRDGTSGPRRRQAVGGLVILVALADVLFLDFAPGISLAVFALAVAGVVWLLLRRQTGLIGPGMLLVLSALPVVEYVQALSVAFLMGGSAVALCWAVLGRSEGAALRRLVSLYPFLAIRQAIEAVRQSHITSRTDGAIFHILRAWGFPIGGALVLMALMLSANPVLSDWADRIWRFDIRLDRMLFWLGAAVMIWPVLAVSVQPELLAPRAGPARMWDLPGLGLNAGSVANALITFNLLLAIQTGMDVLFLWGSADLPDGMSHAEYAHRGAYPLLATALLAGAFALAARPFLAEQPGLTRWMMLWLAQNVLLVISSLMRLSLYVDAYGLTYLRVHAAIWMALVAAGLCLTGWQILQGKSNKWLLLRSATLGIGVLYACCFINFAALIARENLHHPQRYDEYYVCQLGPMAAAEIAASPRLTGCPVQGPQITNWREWGFRADRVIRSLKTEMTPEIADENPRRG